MKFFAMLLLIALTLFLGIQGYRLLAQRSSYKDQIEELTKKTNGLRTENAEIAEDLEFYSNSENAVKELQSRVNYHKPDEKMLILVPAENQ